MRDLQPQPPAGARLRPRSGTRRWIAIPLALALLAAIVAVLTSKWTASPSPTRTAAQVPAPTATLSASLKPVDGGPRYYARFPNSLPSDPSYFPIGVWLESVLSPADVDADQRAGLNLYVGLTSDSDLPLIARSGMKVIAQQEDWLDDAHAPGSEAIAGWLLADEIDMQMSPRKGVATLRSLREAIPAGDGRLRYSNFGKGVTFWNTDAQAARYVNGNQDVVSADNYWFTDRDLCGASEGGELLATGGKRLRPLQCHLAANYGRTVDRVRDLVRPARSRPVWVFVEVGHPSAESSWPSMNPAEVSAAVWSGIIHGARGVVYFNHSFGGRAQTQHALREPAYAAVRTQVESTNGRIRRLAPVLNAPFVERFASTAAAVDAMTKRSGGRLYVFAGSRANQMQHATFRVPCAGDARVSVLDEGRTLRLNNGSFVDSFADGNAVHIYRIDDDSACRLPGA
jgi:hypothetical protein